MRESFKIICDMIKNQTITYEQAWELMKDVVGNSTYETNRWWNPAPQSVQPWYSTTTWKINEDTDNTKADV